MGQAIGREVFEELGSDLFECLCAARILSDGLNGLGGLVFGLVEVATHSEVTPESLSVVMEKLYEYADVAKGAEDTILKMRKPAT